MSNSSSTGNSDVRGINSKLKAGNAAFACVILPHNNVKFPGPRDE
jgi:hypothetical protein